LKKSLPCSEVTEMEKIESFVDLDGMLNPKAPKMALKAFTLHKVSYNSFSFFSAGNSKNFSAASGVFVIYVVSFKRL
jgi:hypothetical protein